MQEDESYLADTNWMESQRPARSLQQNWKTVVETAAEFVRAVAQGATHIEVQAHLDMSLAVTTVFNWTATFHLPETIKTIRVRPLQHLLCWPLHVVSLHNRIGRGRGKHGWIYILHQLASKYHH